MEITEQDRNALRANQQKLVPEFSIGKIVEHKVQDPRKYKQVSRKEQASNGKPNLPRPDYQSKYFTEQASPRSKPKENHHQADSSLSNLKQQDLPIAIEDVQANLWLNMDKVEVDKMEWMGSKAEELFRERLKKTTHFDSNGRPVPKDAPNMNGQIVHDVESLVEMLDGDYDPKVTYALNLISKIAAYATLGSYDDMFDENIHRVLITNCLLRVRHHIDSTNETVCLSALKCLRSLLSNAALDEIFLDRMSPLSSHQASCYWLQTDIMVSSAEAAYGLKDQECAEIDAVFALVKQTNLLVRLRYLLTHKLGQFKDYYSDCILDILLRIARHSREVCYVIVHEELLDLVILDFMTTNILKESKLRQSLAIRAVKLVRIIAQASVELISIQSSVKIKIPKSTISAILPYYYLDCYEEPQETGNHLFILCIETFRLMRTLIEHPDCARGVMDMIHMDLSYLCKILKTFAALDSTAPIKSRISLDWQLAAHSIDFIGTVVNYERLNDLASVGTLWNSYAGPITMKWIYNLIEGTCIPHLDVSIAVASLVGLVKRFGFDKNEKMTNFHAINALLLASKDQAKDDAANAGLKFFNKLLQSAIQKSQVCDALKIDGRRRDPEMLPSFGCLSFNDTPHEGYKFSNIIENDSPFVLLEMFVDLLRENPSRQDDFIEGNLNVDRYSSLATRYQELPVDYERTVQSSILAQKEISIMSKLILLKAATLSRKLGGNRSSGRVDNKTTCDSQFFFDALSIIALINPRVEHLVNLKDLLLEDVVFNDKLHTCLDMEYHKPTRDVESPRYNDSAVHTGDHGFSALDRQTLSQLKLIYLNCEQPGRYWIFQPMIEFYNAHVVGENAKNESDQRALDAGKWFASTFLIDDRMRQLDNCSDAAIVRAILTLNATFMHHIVIYNQLMVRTKLEEYLCLVGSIFLDDNLIFEENVANAVQSNIAALVGDNAKDGCLFRDASRKLETLGLMLSDFFNKIVDQFEAISYGNTVFSNFLLLFINPKSDIVFKKKLFSEKLETCLTQIRLRPGQVWPFDHIYFRHREEDSEIRMLMKLARPYLASGSFLESYVKHHTTDGQNNS